MCSPPLIILILFSVLSLSFPATISPSKNNYCQSKEIPHKLHYHDGDHSTPSLSPSLPLYPSNFSLSLSLSLYSFFLLPNTTHHRWCKKQERYNTMNIQITLINSQYSSIICVSFLNVPLQGPHMLLLPTSFSHRTNLLPIY